jgi:hypothetical protein
MNGRGDVDPRPWFVLAVTGHEQAVEPGPWMWRGLDPNLAFAAPGARALVNYLDAVLWHKKATHRVSVHCRGADTGVDHLVRVYATARYGSFLLVNPQRDLFGPDADYRRDLELVLRAHALVWYGPREPGPDPVTIAAALGIPYRVVPGTAVGGDVRDDDEPQEEIAWPTSSGRSR